MVFEKVLELDSESCFGCNLKFIICVIEMFLVFFFVVILMDRRVLCVL